MVLLKILNSRTYQFARSFSSLRNGGFRQNIFQHIQVAKRGRVLHSHNPDISLSYGVMCIVVGGVPIAAVGMYITKTLRDMIEGLESGEIMPNSRSQPKLTNDQWLVLKQQAQALLKEEEEDDDDEAVAVETEAEPVQEEEIVAAVQEPEKSEPIVTPGKDKVIFIDPPSQE